MTLPFELVKPREAALIMEAVSHLSDVEESLRAQKKPVPPQIQEAKRLLVEAFKQIWEK